MAGQTRLHYALGPATPPPLSFALYNAPVTALDRILQHWRIAKAARYLSAGARVLDVGCHDGALFRRLRSRLSGGIGLDPGLGEPVTFGPFRLVPGRFPQDLPEADPFDAVTMLAVLEHLRPADQRAAAAACRRCLRPGGRVIVTVPSPRVDRLVALLQRLRLAHGMALEEHYGFRPETTPELFQAEGFETQTARSFQLGLNHLYVFRKSEPPQ